MGESSSPHAGITLYAIPPSFYSQVARLVLAEKGVAYRRVIVAPGPPSYETYEPWYMRLNPMGTVPTLVIGEAVLDDSRHILAAVEDRFEGPALLPADEASRALVEHWIEEAYGVPERVLAYGSDRLKGLGEKVNHSRLKALKKWRQKTPDMAAVYDHKIADITSFMAESRDTVAVEASWQATHNKLDRLDEQLTQTRFCTGDTYTLADVVWTVTVARQQLLGSDPFPNRPALQAWFARMQGRPSYKQADVWTRFKPEVMLPVLLNKYKWRALGLAIVLAWVTATLLAI